MSKVKTIIINVSDLIEIALLIVQDDQTKNNLKDMVLFWVGGQSRIDEYGGNIEKAFCDQFARRFFMDAIEDGHFRALNRFKNGEVEGYDKMDGSSGITIKEATEFESDDLEVTITDMGCV